MSIRDRSTRTVQSPEAEKINSERDEKLVRGPNDKEISQAEWSSPMGRPEGVSENVVHIDIDQSIIDNMAEGAFEGIWALYRSSTEYDAHIREFAAQHPEIAGKQLAKFLKTYVGGNSDDAILGLLKTTDPAVAFDFVAEGYGNFQKGNAQVKVILAFIKKGDIKGAIDRTERIPSFDARARAIANISHNMSDQDLLKNHNWIEPMLPEEKAGIIRGLGSDRLPNFEGLESWPLRELLEEQIRPRLVRDLAHQLYERRSLEEIQERFSQLEDLGTNQNDREIIEQKWASDVGHYHPEDAVWAVELMQHAGEALVLRSIGTKLDESPQEAFELASRLPSGYHDLSADRIIKTWYRNDSIAASTYITQMEPGSLRYQAALSLAERLENDGRTEDAIRWRQWAEQQAAE